LRQNIGLIRIKEKGQRLKEKEHGTWRKAHGTWQGNDKRKNSQSDSTELVAELLWYGAWCGV